MHEPSFSIIVNTDSRRAGPCLRHSVGAIAEADVERTALMVHAGLRRRARELSFFRGG
jgi:hypothetical protein